MINKSTRLMGSLCMHACVCLFVCAFIIVSYCTTCVLGMSASVLYLCDEEWEDMTQPT